MFRLLFPILVATTAPAFAVESTSITVQKAYLSQGYDSNDRVQLLVTGTLPNTCYRLGATETKVDSQTGEIELTQTAYYYQGVCLQMQVPFEQTVDLGLIESPRNYKVVDSTNAADLGELPINAAKTTNADDYNYASINEVVIRERANGRLTATLQGYLPNSCWSLTEKRVIVENADVVTILPIMTQTQTEMCTQALRPFVATVQLPAMSAGRRMLHVRSLNGRAVLKTFEAR